MIHFTCVNESRGFRIPHAALKKVGAAAAKEFRIKKKSTVNLIVTRAEKARTLNKKFRGKTYTPDVLTFEYPEEQRVGSHGSMLGEIVITDSVLKRQAKERGHSLTREFTILAVHGIVHMMGFEHEGVSDRAKAAMEQHEKHILLRLGLSPKF